MLNHVILQIVLMNSTECFWTHVSLPEVFSVLFFLKPFLLPLSFVLSFFRSLPIREALLRRLRRWGSWYRFSGEARRRAPALGQWKAGFLLGFRSSAS